jgi:hypothetical protein
MSAIEDIKQAFLEYAQTETNIVGVLPAKREDAVALIEYMKDKCSSISIWNMSNDDEWTTYSWHPVAMEGWGRDAGWVDDVYLGGMYAVPTKELPIEGGERVKFLGVKPKEQWT